ncbi:unnamed protein product [Ectocarpus sp. CCAP 1310/34]|nr:unnamed protein product [Ectocarpus sp. CCAP 1310/34]
MAQRLWRTLRGRQNPLPSANPKNWPEPTIEDVLERPTRISLKIMQKSGSAALSKNLS